ncbi:hypothetical protein N7468_006912 [Penicillium chermesinum]|uniref:Telomere length regulation protein conserved domain-containing protein n=1 Tax=Penicillium chermesinum TaxID=63820 RepID=A0A9W9NT38_9EURO|nr:uncharacterized protein N7468_006912 [Penicillium chermesinum]KAJ5225687.1 hypothetical protein N7468_006912 [Penicillium chermesinum]KAJ6161094.1 hypothetical protein N7470_004490 [Penicillium chermesinum]
MDDLLTAVKTVKQSNEPSSATIQPNNRNDAAIKISFDLAGDLAPTQIIDLLKSRPSQEELSSVLATLDPYNKSRKLNLDLRIPGPATTQILQVLVSTTIPDHWAPLSDGKHSKDVKSKSALLRCLSSVPGIAALLSQLRLLISARNSPQKAEASSGHATIQDLLSVTAALLEPQDFLFRLRKDIETLYQNPTRQKIAWNELLALVASGKIISVAAEALTCLNGAPPPASIIWISEGRSYAPWIGRNISLFISRLEPTDEPGLNSVASLTERSLSLGYSSLLIPSIYSHILDDPSFAQGFRLFLSHLRHSAQVTVLQLILVNLPVKHPAIRACDYPADQSECNDVISGIAALLSRIIGDRAEIKHQIADWLTKGQITATFSTGVYRGVLTIFNTDALQNLLMRSLENFGDKFAINHNSDRDHDANAQVILLAAGRLCRLDSSRVKEAGRSSAYLNAISNRIGSSSNRARFMGMVVGTAISSLIDEPGNSMKFDLDEMKSDEAKWYLSLTKIFDEVGSFDSMKALSNSLPSKPAPKKPSQKIETPSRGSRIVEVPSEDEDEDEEEEDDDLIPYEKPDDDFEDEEDDPTLVQRNKPTAPVYIRDLITYLRDNENVERYHLALSTAPSLIRRKTGFGSELAEQVEELALTIVGLQNESDYPQFHEARLQSMIGLIVSQPQKMGRWFTAIFFEGDLSQVQRSAVLTALGISAREIAGNGEDDAKALGLPALKDTSFPSKRLTPALEAMFQDPKESPVAALTREISRTSLQPLAADAADAVSGPNALKVRTFSSRMDVERRRQERDAQRQRSTAKELHKVLAEGFFYPLVNRFNVVMLQFSSSSFSSYNPFTVPHILTLFLQTLSLILSTSGPYTTFLPGLTQETLSLLLSLHTSPFSSEPTVSVALLTLFLALLDLNIASGSNGEERLVTELASQVIELREWASQVFDNTPPTSKAPLAPGGPPDPREQVRTLAAGVMVRLGEITERYQGRLMGVNSGFKY